MKSLLDSFDDDNAIVQDWCCQQGKLMDAEIDALSDGGFSDTSSLDEEAAMPAAADDDDDESKEKADGDAMQVDQSAGRKLSQRFRRRDLAIHDEVGDLAEGNPAALSPESYMPLKGIEKPRSSFRVILFYLGGFCCSLRPPSCPDTTRRGLDLTGFNSSLKSQNKYIKNRYSHENFTKVQRPIPQWSPQAFEHTEPPKHA